MVQYSLAQSPEIILTVPGKDSAKARDKAMDQLMELMDAGELPTELEEGFGPQQLIEVKESITDTSSREDEITHLKEGFKVLKTFAQANLRYQEARGKAEQARQILDQALKSPD